MKIYDSTQIREDKIKVLILGGAGFIGTNLSVNLLHRSDLSVSIYDRKKEYFDEYLLKPSVNLICGEFTCNVDFDKLLKGYDVIFHLESTSSPTNSNKQIANELDKNVVVTAALLDACVRQNVKRVIFLSSGGTVYGKDVICPVKEDAPLKPITSYGLQKMCIEKLLYLYNYMYGMDYKIVRLSNPYGPYQRPYGPTGVVSTFVYKALRNEEVSVFGDGCIIRDFIYIDDAIRAIINIAFDGISVNEKSEKHTFNIGCGYGTSVNEVINCINETLNVVLRVKYEQSRQVDVPINVLDISKYESIYGTINSRGLCEGINETASFMSQMENR